MALRLRAYLLSASLGTDRWHIRVAIIAALVLVCAAGALAGAFRGTEHRLEQISFDLLARPASGQVHVVEMDAASMATIRRWPWPRDHYARVVGALDAAGARSISFDVDVSSAGDPAGDAAFGAAIAAARAPVALPTFAQRAGAGNDRQLDSLPIPVLREQAHLVSVSVRPDRDGTVRSLPLGTITSATPRPSLSAFVAGQAGLVEEEFPVDFAIDPATIPRHSFTAVEHGLILPGSLKDKDVIVGATAIELGDRYTVPGYGVVPGVIVQALAAETLYRGVPARHSGVLPLLLAAGLAFAVLGARRRKAVIFRTSGAAAMLLGLWLGARLALGLWADIVPALMLVAAAGAIRHIVLSRRRAARALQIDTETGLPNRRGLNLRTRHPSDRFLVAAQIDDLDALKLAIDGEGIGTLLRRVAERLKVASSAPTLYRIEERTLVWMSALPIDELEGQLAGVRALMRSPFEIEGRRIGVSLTFGVADAAEPEPAALAAHAASQAKRSGKFWRLHSADEGEAINRQLALLGELEEALHNGEIAVLYQPKLNLVTDRIDAVEALVRWNHPERGLIPPDCFIPLFEERGRIDDLTIAVLAKSLEDMRVWCDLGLTIGVAVNISAALLSSESFASRALAQVERSGAPAQRITFEVTESAQFEDAALAIATLEQFRAAGIRISMDDYGTGQSTLNYLKVLPLSELKIDRMFVAAAHVDRGDAMLVRSTVQLAHELGLKVVAEGIEEGACLAFLRQIGCDYAQGYFIGRPLKADDLAALVVQTGGQGQPPARAPAQAQAQAA